MACFRSIVSTRNLLRRTQRSSVFAYALNRNDENHNLQSPWETSLQHPSAISQKDSGPFSSHRFISSPLRFGQCSTRYMSSATSNLDINLHSSSDAVTEGIDISAILKDGSEIFDGAVQTLSTQAPVVNEVAIAAADSAFPVAALQFVIDAVHSFTGFNWWASIALTTLLIRGVTIPLLISQLKATQKLTILKPRLEEIQRNPQGLSMMEVSEETKKLFKEHGVTPFTPLRGLFIQAPIFISFFFAISNMSEKVASMKSGGTSWFVDLTTPDSLYIFPVLTAVTFWLTVEFNSQEGMEGNAHASTIKNVSRIFALLTVPFTASFPNAIFCYWITSNMFSLTYGCVLKVPGVKKFLGIPDLPVRPPPTDSKPFNIFEAIQQARSQARAHVAETETPPEQKKSSNQRVSVLNQRIRSLEKQVKGKRKNKKI